MELMPFQKEAVEKMLGFLQTEPACATYNACEQGLGKTVQALAALSSLEKSAQKHLRVLILAPNVMLYTWKKEVKTWLGVDATVISKGSDMAYTIGADIIITTHDLARSYGAYLEKIHFDVLVIDEAQLVKNSRAKRTKVILGKLWPKIKYRIALSGTPMTQSVADAFSLFSRMAPDEFPSYSNFVGKYAHSIETLWGPKYVGIKNAPKLRTIIRSKFLVRYEKKEVLPDLPRKVYKEILLPASTYLLPEYEGEMAKLSNKEIFEKIERGEDVSKLYGIMAELRRKQGEVKVPAVIEYVTNLLEQNIPVILFGYHHNVLDAYEEALKDHTPIVIRGGVSAKGKFAAQEDFQSGKSNLFIGQTEAAGVGITLTRSSNVVHGEYVWSPSKFSQANDRVNRIGATETSIIHLLVVENSLENKIIESMIAKAKAFDKVLGSKHK